jgi:hypothetical protein
LLGFNPSARNEGAAQNNLPHFPSVQAEFFNVCAVRWVTAPRLELEKQSHRPPDLSLDKGILFGCQ